MSERTKIVITFFSRFLSTSLRRFSLLNLVSLNNTQSIYFDCLSLAIYSFGNHSYFEQNGIPYTCYVVCCSNNSSDIISSYEIQCTLHPHGRTFLTEMNEDLFVMETLSLRHLLRNDVEILTLMAVCVCYTKEAFENG